MNKFEYAPAPESRDIARLKSSYQIFVDGRFRDGAGPATKTINPARAQPLAEVTEAGPSDVDDAVKAARRAYDKVWSKTPGRDRAKYLFRIARAIQETRPRTRRARVARQRQADQGIARHRHSIGCGALLLLRRWADKLDYAGFGASPRPLGVAAQ